MKKKLLLGLLMISTSVITFNACSTADSETSTKEQTASISFSVEQNDLMLSRTGTSNERPDGEITENLSDFCPENAELEDQLHAEITLMINGVQSSNDVPIKKDKQGKLYTQPFEIPDGLHQLISFQVHNKKNQKCQILFSTVNRTSKYMQHIPAGYHQGDQYFIVNALRPGQVKPINQSSDGAITIHELKLYDKPVIPIHVLCAVNMPAKEFTYSMHEINMGKVYCFPFSTNLCECEVDCQGIKRVMDHIGKGTLTMQRQKNTGTIENPNWENEGNLITIKFPAEENTLAKICFKDDYTVINNDLESYYFTIQFEDNEKILDIDCDCKDTQNKGDIFEVRKTVTELKNYHLEKIWSTTYRYLHLNFCDLESTADGVVYPWGFSKKSKSN